MSSRASSALLVAGCCLVSAQQQQSEQQQQPLAAAPRTSAGLPGGLRNLENIRRKRVLTTRLEAQEQARQRAASADNGNPRQQRQLQQPESIYSAEDADAFFAESNFFDLRHLQQSMDTDAPTVDDTDAPTPAPTPLDCNSDPDVREAAVDDLLSPISDDIGDPSTPAGQAAEWILNGDPAMPDPCRDPDAVVTRFALTTFYYSTGGEQWRNNDGWLTEAPACDWFGVGCDGDNIVELNMGALLSRFLLAAAVWTLLA